ncbi:MAG: hypothetical protein RR012_07570 [Oscillospiraceae bacterium]
MLKNFELTRKHVLLFAVGLFLLHIIIWKCSINNIYDPIIETNLKNKNNISYNTYIIKPHFLRYDGQLAIFEKKDFKDGERYIHGLFIFPKVNGEYKIIFLVDYEKGNENIGDTVTICFIEINEQMRAVKFIEQETVEEYKPEIEKLFKEAYKEFGIKLDQQ